MTIKQEQINNMKDFQDKVSSFIKNVSTPIKKEHSANIEKYLDKFIKFPGSLSVISVFFVSSDLVQNQPLALFGVGLVISSLIIALNIFRVSVDNDHSFYQNVVNLEKPMLLFSRRFTQFSRGEAEGEQLLKSYENLQDSYRENSKNFENKNDGNKGLTFIKNSINLSFYILLVGVVICFISAINLRRGTWNMSQNKCLNAGNVYEDKRGQVPF